MIGTVEIGGNEAGSVTGKRIETVGDLDHGNAVVAHALESVKEREKDRQEVVEDASSGSRRRERERERGGTMVGDSRSRERSRERKRRSRSRDRKRDRERGKGLDGEEVSQGDVAPDGEERVLEEHEGEVGEGMEERRDRKGTETEGVATGTKRGAGEIGTETGSTKGSGVREIKGIAGKNGMYLCAMAWVRRMTWALRMREEHHLTWRTTVRMG